MTLSSVTLPCFGWSQPKQANLTPRHQPVALAVAADRITLRFGSDSSVLRRRAQHELGHALIAELVGMNVTKLRVTPNKADVTFRDERSRPEQWSYQDLAAYSFRRAMIAVAGPVAEALCNEIQDPAALPMRELLGPKYGGIDDYESTRDHLCRSLVAEFLSLHARDFQTHRTAEAVQAPEIEALLSESDPQTLWFGGAWGMTSGQVNDRLNAVYRQAVTVVADCLKPLTASQRYGETTDFIAQTQEIEGQAQMRLLLKGLLSQVDQSQFDASTNNKALETYQQASNRSTTP